MGEFANVSLTQGENWTTGVQQVGRLENAIGWYHSHPGYGCWLSGIDVNTQMTNQQYQDPFVAVVVSDAISMGLNFVCLQALSLRPISSDLYSSDIMDPDRPQSHHLRWARRHWSLSHLSTREQQLHLLKGLAYQRR